MNRGRGTNAGYTIVETMIFLAVSGALFVSAMLLISGQQNKTEFTQGVRDTQSSLQDIANDIATGYYANVPIAGGNIRCAINSGSISLTSGGDRQGANNGCIFIGKALQFAPHSLPGSYNIITLVGKQRTGPNIGDPDTTSYIESGVRPAAPLNPADPTPNATQQITLDGGVTIGCVFYLVAAGANPASTKPCTMTPSIIKVDLLTFMTTFRGNASLGRQQSGSVHTDIVVSNSSAGSTMGRTLGAAAGELNNYGNSAGNTVKNPAGGVYICLQSNGSDQYGLVSLGGANSGTAVQGGINQGTCS